MEMRNCPKCGRLFTYVKNPICESCVKDEESKFEDLKKYIEENPLCSMTELSDETGVAKTKIIRYVKEGRLEISNGMRGEVRCDSCGKPINKGRYCDSCVIKMSQDVEDIYGAGKKPAARMHTVQKKL